MLYPKWKLQGYGANLRKRGHTDLGAIRQLHVAQAVDRAYI